MFHIAHSAAKFLLLGIGFHFYVILFFVWHRLRRTIVKPKQAGTCGRNHPRCQISIFVQFFFFFFCVWWKIILHIILEVNKLNMFYSILYKYSLVILTDAHFLCSAHKCQLALFLL